MAEPIIKGLAELIARDIFHSGDEPGSATQRIQFMGGKYPDNELPQGGLCELALAKLIEESIDCRLRGEPFLTRSENAHAEP